MNIFTFTKNWQKEFLKLDILTQNRIIDKLQFLKSIDNINPFLKVLIWFEPATHRLRVWDFRIILQQIDTTNFLIIDVWTRGNIYKW